MNKQLFEQVREEELQDSIDLQEEIYNKEIEYLQRFKDDSARKRLFFDKIRTKNRINNPKFAKKDKPLPF